MSESQALKRQYLLTERQRLDRQGVQLRVETIQLERSRDVALLRELSARLASHVAEMAAFGKAVARLPQPIRLTRRVRHDELEVLLASDDRCRTRCPDLRDDDG